jgi:hypothetical protein
MLFDLYVDYQRFTKEIEVFSNGLTELMWSGRPINKEYLKQIQERLTLLNEEIAGAIEEGVDMEYGDDK